MVRKTLMASVVSALLLGAIVWSDVASAAPVPPPGPGTAAASVKVLAIRATKEDKDYMDPALATLAEELRRTAGGFNAFRLLMQAPRTIPFGETQSITLVEGYEVRVKPIQASDDTIELAISVGRGEAGKGGLSTTLRIRKGKYMLLAGWKLKEGNLLVAVSAR